MSRTPFRASGIAAACLLASGLFLATSLHAQQPRDDEYSRKIIEYTTAPHFLTELVDHVPASSTVPTPLKVLGYVSGAPQKLTYASDVHRYMRALEKASTRVKVFSIGTTEEGREMILVLISDEANLRRLDELKAITAKLSDSRITSPEEADKLIASAVPFYWATGGMHSTETGSPEMQMELAYRLAVEETPFIQKIRKDLVVMLTPVLEVDGREKVVDLYNYKVANPGKPIPRAAYWGKYVSHDNNRDGMVLSLALSRNVTKAFLEYHPQVIHDLHESMPFLYISTGMGPYNAWLDPIVINEWQELAYNEVEQMTRRGVPGIWTQGFYDGWAANYMFTVAHGHNAIGRFYETYGGFGADTGEREIPKDYTTREWFRPNPPLPKVNWSLRNNVNLQQSALLFALNYTATNKEHILHNFYLKSKRSVEKARNEGPAAWIIPAGNPRPVESAHLVNLLRLHGVEVHRLTEELKIEDEEYPAESYVIRMDQPYSRMADMLLDQGYYNANDTSPYDDTGWSFGPLRNVKTERIGDRAVLEAPMELMRSDAQPEGSLEGDGKVYLVNHNADSVLAPFRFRLKDVKIRAAEKPFKVGGTDYSAGSMIIRESDNGTGLRARLEQAAQELGVDIDAVESAPEVPTHPLAVPRIALVHTWISTQTEGWYRLAFDTLGIPYDYISDQKLRSIPNLRERYNVIVFGPVSSDSRRIVNGLPSYGGDPMPWKTSALTPNIATSPDQTDDMRGGMGLEGITMISQFVEAGGLFVTIGGNASIPIDYGLIDFVSIEGTRNLKARGSVLMAELDDIGSPIAYGYDNRLAVYFNQAPVFRVSVPGAEPSPTEDSTTGRSSGRGTLTDPDIPQGRPYTAPEKPDKDKKPEMTVETKERLSGMIPPDELKPRIIFKFAPEKELLVSGMLAGGSELAGKPAVVDVPKGKGHYLLFAINPMWRQETQGSFSLLFNAMLNFDNLGVGRDQKGKRDSGVISVTVENPARKGKVAPRP
jgi:hypothetical protein